MAPWSRPHKSLMPISLAWITNTDSVIQEDKHWMLHHCNELVHILRAGTDLRTRADFRQGSLLLGEIPVVCPSWQLQFYVLSSYDPVGPSPRVGQSPSVTMSLGQSRTRRCRPSTPTRACGAQTQPHPVLHWTHTSVSLILLFLKTYFLSPFNIL